MAADDYVVRPILPSDYLAWLDMWQRYCDFYEMAIPEVVTNNTWSRIVDPDSTIHALIAVSTAATFGFANYVIHPFTWSERSACYLEDLFVRQEMRDIGVGQALLAHLIALSRQQRWGRLYWMTRENNSVARHLYDRFSKRDDFVRYVVTFGDAAANGD